MSQRNVKSQSVLAGRVGPIAVALIALAAPANAQTFISGSDGSDGPFNASGPPGTVIVFDPAQFSGTQVAANIFNFTTITVDAGVTVKFTATKLNAPVYLLAQGNVNIAGTLDFNGGNGAGGTENAYTRSLASVPGTGGYAGGAGGDGVQLSTAGTGPGGGSRGTAGSHAGGGTFTGNSVLIPLVGGSGGGGGQGPGLGSFGAGGGAGGGAVLIAGSSQVSITGFISANGGNAGPNNGTCAGGGSGGAIRIVATSITGSGTLRANGGGTCGNGGGQGRIRLEAFANNFTGSIQGSQGQSVPNQLLLPTAGSPGARVISVGGTPITANPDTFPDVTINTTAPVDVVIQTQNIPSTATIQLTVLGEGGADTTITAPALSNCVANTCTTTVQVPFRSGASRGLTRITWTQ